MKYVFKFLLLVTTLMAFTAKADVVLLEQIKETNVAVSSPYIISASKAKVYVSSGTGQSIRLTLKKLSGESVLVLTKDTIGMDDRFVISGVTYHGHIFELTGIPEGQFTIVVQRGNLEIPNQLITDEYPLTSDQTVPSINGSFFWNSSSTQYWRIHDDGKFVVSQAGARMAGFSNASVGISGYSHATFSSIYLDGPNVGKTHAKDLPAHLTSAGDLIIGTGVDNSISTAYLPLNTSARMRFTYKLYNKAGIFVEKSEDLYVATRTTQSKPQPYGLFTGQDTILDGVPAFAGFIPYTPGMTVTTNPVRMIYRANRNHYFGGGGDADIYGGWVNSTRNTNRVVHMDDQYLYFDVDGSTNGSNLNEASYFVRDLSIWRHHLFEHKLTLAPSIMPPQATEIAYFQTGSAKWLSHPSSLVTYITKDNTNGQTDSISKIRITVQPREYSQRFSYDFITAGPRYQGTCIIPVGETVCVIDTNLPYPGDDVSNYYNRHKIMAIGRSLVSNEIVSNWLYDGAPATVIPSTIQHNKTARTITFTVKKDYVARLSGNAIIRSVRLTASPQSIPASRIDLEQTNISTNLVNGSQHNTYTFSYANLPEGKFTFYAYVEDGFGSTNSRHKREHKLIELTSIDQTPPIITTNITENALTSLKSLLVSLNDTSNAYVQSMIVTGGSENIKFGLPFSQKEIKKFAAEYIFLNPSEDKPYQLTVTAIDEVGNVRISTFDFHYRPQLTRIPDTKIAAIASPLRDPQGVPHNILLTPQIRNSDGVTAKGVHKVYFTLMAAAELPLNVNGIDVSPGQTASFDVNLSATNHRLRLVMFPKNSGSESTNDFQVHIPNIKVAVCPESFEESGSSCIYLNFKPANVACPDGFTPTENKLACQKTITYQPKTQCAEGYLLDNLTCKGSYSVAPTATCPTSFGLSEGGSACNRTTTFAVKLCPEGQIYEDSMCKDPVGNFTPTSLYCNGVDVSKSPSCQNGTCTSYNSEWNACEVNTRAATKTECASGHLVDGQCVISHNYDLNVSCPFGYNREALNCTRLEIIDPIKSCDANWEQISTGCIQQEYSQFLSCPPTHIFKDGRCHEKAAVIINCPETYTWNGTVCARTDREPASPVCPSSYIWSVPNSRCEQEQTIPANPICPTNYVWVAANNRCETTVVVPGTPNCQSGYQWSEVHSVCEQLQSSLATPICQAQYIWNGTVCAKPETQAATPNCPSGFAWSAANSRCEKFEQIPATPNCQTGYTWSGANLRCEKTETLPHIKNCGTGYSYNSQTQICEKTSTQPATPTCESGYSWSTQSSRCEQTISQPAEPICDPTLVWSEQNDQCENTLSQPAAKICNSGYDWSEINNRCELPQTQPATAVCASGYNWSSSNSRCEREEQTAATPNCSSGYSWSITNSRCEKVETVPYIKNCAVGFTLNPATGLCDRLDQQPATPVCASGYIWSIPNNRCEMNLTLPAEQICGAGYSWSPANSRCEMTQTQPATPNCASGYIWSFSNSHCVKNQTKPATPVCAAGYDWSTSNKRCEKTETKPQLERCNSSHTWTEVSQLTGQPVTCEVNLVSSSEFIEGCYYGYKLACEVEGTCAVQNHPSRLPCFEGVTTNYNLSKCEAGWEESQEFCKRVVSQNPTAYTCSSGWSLDNTTCTLTSVQPPVSYQCPRDWYLSETTCSILHTAPAQGYSCSSGWVLNSNQCTQLQTQPAQSFTCPPSWTVSGSQCQYLTTQPATNTCSETFIDIGSQCSRTLTQPVESYSCLSGWVLSGSTCKQLLTQPPQSYVCPADWTLSGSQCNRTLSQGEIGYHCPANWALSGSTCTQLQTGAPQSYQCESGWFLSGSTCSKLLTKPAQSYNCPINWTISSTTCSLLETQPATNTCANTYNDNGILCTRTVTLPVESYSCLNGWTVNSNMCDRLLTDVPVYSCSPSWSLSGNQCNRTLTAAPTEYICDSGWDLNSTTCNRVVNTQPQSYTCSSGWALSGSNCSQIQSSAPSSYTCDSSWALFGSNCKRTLFGDPESYSCKSGWDLNVQECSRQATETETRTCSSLFALQDPQTCIKVNPSDFVGNCEAGWIGIATQCRFTKNKDFNLSCESGFELMAQQCRRTLNQPVTVDCQNGDVLVDGRCESNLTVPVINTCDAPYTLIDKQCRIKIEINNFDQI